MFQVNWSHKQFWLCFRLKFLVICVIFQVYLKSVRGRTIWAADILYSVILPFNLKMLLLKLDAAFRLVFDSVLGQLFSIMEVHIKCAFYSQFTIDRRQFVALFSWFIRFHLTWEWAIKYLLIINTKIILSLEFANSNSRWARFKTSPRVIYFNINSHRFSKCEVHVLFTKYKFSLRIINVRSKLFILTIY